VGTMCGVWLSGGKYRVGSPVLLGSSCFGGCSGRCPAGNCFGLCLCLPSSVVRSDRRAVYVFLRRRNCRPTDRPAVDPHPGPAMVLLPKRPSRVVVGSDRRALRVFFSGGIADPGSPGGRSPPSARYGLCYPKDRAASRWGVTAGHSAFSRGGGTADQRIARRSIPTQDPILPLAHARPGDV